MNTHTNTWNVIYTKPRHEKKVAEQLNYIKLEHYLPTVRTLKLWNGRKKYVTLPLFPSYLFVKPENTRHYFESLHIPGVLHYLHTNRQLSEVSDQVICKLKAISNHQHFDFQLSTEHFSPGSIVHIQAGPFMGFPCEVVQNKGKHKILVRIELLQRSLLVDLPEESLHP
jgi:transcription antitermination factor NusG